MSPRGKRLFPQPAKVLHGDVRLRVREIIRQGCPEMGVTIINGALSKDHVHMFVEIPPNVSVSDFVHRAKGGSSRKIQQEFEHIRKRYWDSASGKGAISRPPPATSPMTSSCGIWTNIPTRMASAPPHGPTGVSRPVIQLTSGAGHFLPTNIRSKTPDRAPERAWSGR